MPSVAFPATAAATTSRITDDPGVAICYEHPVESDDESSASTVTRIRRARRLRDFDWHAPSVDPRARDEEQPTMQPVPDQGVWAKILRGIMEVGRFVKKTYNPAFDASLLV